MPSSIWHITESTSCAQYYSTVCVISGNVIKKDVHAILACEQALDGMEGEKKEVSVTMNIGEIKNK